MPVTCQQSLTPLDRESFGRLSYDVYAQILVIRKELGRFFDEKHYKRALSLRRDDVAIEVPVIVSHKTFQKPYYLDLLLAHGAILEFKAAEALVARHKAQLMHYLMLVDLPHGMLINIRPERVSREFVNNALTRQERMRFEVINNMLKPKPPGADVFQQHLCDLLHDWGTCLDLALYEEALTHFFGGDDQVVRPASVVFQGSELGSQNLRFVTGKTAFKLTAFEKSESQRLFASHAQRLVNHAQVEALLWANIARHQITFRSLVPEK
ncbi:MAG: GxxExxY protein [Prosthecobacter sp.]|jgi:GxxExxY protein|uniref:GxxExxY protein n=1 Tax=Prosthecobacter sp. TaxID=1965333 RepID=UPI0019EDB78D|nr:GxxExxY protein [Prosthecobacter sp.]MBE2284882.1 GxxExxY protein [Prosthecobacter sp.]